MATSTLEKSVEQRAYEIFQERGGVHGSDQEDWFRAEHELGKKSRGKKSNMKSGAGTARKKRRV